MPSSIKLNAETVGSFLLCDATLNGVVWEEGGRDLALHLLLGDHRPAILRCSWVSDLHIDVSRKGGSPLTWDSRCEQHGQRWWIQLGFASAGAIELECNEAQLDYHAG